MRKSRIIFIGILSAIAVLVMGATVAYAADGNGATLKDPGALGIRGKVLALRYISKEIGIRPVRLVRELKSGKTISEIAIENKVRPAKISAGLLEKIDAGLDRRVANGKLTQAEADAKLAEAKVRIDKAMTKRWGK